MALFRFLRHGSSFPWRATAVLGAHAHGGARGLSYVPVDDVVSGLTEDQIQVKYCVIHIHAHIDEGAWHFELLSRFYGSMVQWTTATDMP